VRLKKEVREVVQYAVALGYTCEGVRKGSGHVRLTLGRKALTIPATPGSYSWRKNAMADIRRLLRQHQEES
jgi:hypothetical protein